MFVIRVKFPTIRVTQDIHVAFQVEAESLRFAQEDKVGGVLVNKMF